MYRIGLVVLGVLLLACNNGEKKENAKGKVTNGGSSEAFGGRFSTVSLPYQLADTTLLKSKDTAQLPADYLSAFLADTTLKNVYILISLVLEKFSSVENIILAIKAIKNNRICIAWRHLSGD